MKVPGRFVVTFEGVRYRVTRRANIVPKELPYLLARLLAGETVAASAFEGYGCRVTVEPCTDQGDDEPDVLADG